MDTPRIGFADAPCIGGPLDGVAVRLPASAGEFVAADRRAGVCWLYRQHDGGGFYAVIDTHDTTTVAGTGERVLDWERLNEPGRPPVVNIQPRPQPPEIPDDAVPVGAIPPPIPD